MYTQTSEQTVTYKGQTRPLVREGVPQRQDNKFQTQTLEKEAISGQTSTKWARNQDVLTDWLPAVKSLWLRKDRRGLSSERAPHRDRTTHSRPKMSSKGSNIWSKMGSIPRHTDWLPPVKSLWLRKDRRGLSSERAPHRDRTTNSRPKHLKNAISGQMSTKWARSQDILTDWLPPVKSLWLRKDRRGLSS
jgi:hypothetical protein